MRALGIVVEDTVEVKAVELVADDVSFGLIGRDEGELLLRVLRLLVVNLEFVLSAFEVLHFK